VQIEPVGVTIQGQLPPWLAGSLVANGGGDYTGSNHMFDGYASLAKVEFSNGQAKASQR
jgi:carotenoid cleavage dioxygenase-like enzyme